MKSVVSTALFGEAEKYRLYLPAAIRAHHNIYRGWVLRIYHDDKLAFGTYSRVLRALEKRGLVELVHVPGEVMHHKAMLWRLLPLWDSDVERFLLRDIDTLPTYRERRAVETWVRSGLAAHAMGDVRGRHDWPMLGGMVGFHASARDLMKAGPGREFDTPDKFFAARGGWPPEVWRGDRRMSNWSSNNQLFLANYVWGDVRANACEHRLSGAQAYDAKLSLTEVDPFDGEDLGVPWAIRDSSDGFVPFIGAAEIDLPAALAFYKQHGDSEVEREVSGCEVKAGFVVEDWVSMVRKHAVIRAKGKL